jgi:hypothetical protein
LKLQYDEPLSNFAFNFNLRPYAMVSWRFVADTRPWYDREDGAYTLSPTCCSVGEAGLVRRCRLNQ